MPTYQTAYPPGERPGRETTDGPGLEYIQVVSAKKGESLLFKEEGDGKWKKKWFRGEVFVSPTIRFTSWCCNGKS